MNKTEQKNKVNNKNNINHIFDIDGTLTPARLPINSDFKKFFLNWIDGKKVYLISGSDYAKSQEQLGDEILNSVSACYNTAGNICFVKGKEIYRNEWTAPKKLIKLLEKYLDKSPHPIRAGTHFEHRIGMLNFSIVGRDCTRAQRRNYHKFDNGIHERDRFCREIMEKFPDIEASVGGQISIDIYAKGKNKGQVVEKIGGPIYFYGDKTQKGGNDYDLAKRLMNPPHKVIQVKNWKETQNILQGV